VYTEWEQFSDYPNGIYVYDIVVRSDQFRRAKKERNFHENSFKTGRLFFFKSIGEHMDGQTDKQGFINSSVYTDQEYF